MSVRKVRVLINPKAGLLWSPESMQKALLKHWDTSGIDLTFQYSLSAEDGTNKTKRAIDDGIDTVLVVGGDGMVNSIGSVLLHTDVALGVIPAGSGNGFARHFGIPLNPNRAAEALIKAERKKIDVGTANGRPFFVTCSMAWDAALVRSFEKSPIRGIIPYIFAAAYEYLEYSPQSFDLHLDNQERIFSVAPLVCTAANLTQYGGGAQIAPDACPNDGFLELVMITKRDAPKVLASVAKMFDGTFNQIPEVMSRKFKTLTVKRQHPGPIQVDGELVEAPETVQVELMNEAITVLVPHKI